MLTARFCSRWARAAAGAPAATGMTVGEIVDPAENVAADWLAAQLEEAALAI